MFSFLYNFIFNLCIQNKLQILPVDETTVIYVDSFDIAVERAVYKLLFNKITKNLNITFDDYNTIYFLPVDKKIKIIQLINRLMKPESFFISEE